MIHSTQQNDRNWTLNRQAPIYHSSNMANVWMHWNVEMLTITFSWKYFFYKRPTASSIEAANEIPTAKAAKTKRVKSIIPFWLLHLPLRAQQLTNFWSWEENISFLTKKKLKTIHRCTWVENPLEGVLYINPKLFVRVVDVVKISWEPIFWVKLHFC